MAIPATLAIASEPILSLADTAMIGHLGVEPLAVRAIASALFAGIYWIFSFLVFGTTTLVAHHYGANEPERCGEIAFHAFSLGLVGGLFISFFGFILAPSLFSIMGADEIVRSLGISYFRIRIITLPFVLIYYATVGFLRGIQNTRIPMLIALLVNGFNIVLDYLFIYGKLGFPALGLTGAAWASALAQATGGVICMKLFFASSYTDRYGLRFQPVNPRRFLPFFRISHEIAVRTAALLFSLIFATAMASRMGTVLLSGHEIAIQLWLFVSYTIDGLAVAGQALVAKYLGSHQADKSFQVGKTLVLWGLAFGTFFAFVYLFLKWPLITLFTTSPEVITTVSGIFLLVALFQPLNGIVFALDGFLIGAHDTRFLMWFMLIGALAIFAPISWISLQLGWGLPGIWTGFTIFMAWRLLTNLIRFFGQRWVFAFPGRS